MSGELAAFARLRALCDFDLQHFGVDQIFRRHAEAAGGDLFDLGVLFGRVACRIFPAFARVRACAQAIHGDGKSLVCFGRQRAQRHPRAVKARKDRLHGFDFLNRNACARVLKLQ